MGEREGGSDCVCNDEAKFALGAILLKYVLYIENIHTR